MIRDFLRNFSFMVAGLWLVGCVSQASLSPFNAAGDNQGSNSGQLKRKIGDVAAEQTKMVPPPQVVEAEKKTEPAMETGSAIKPKPAPKAAPVPEKVSIALKVTFDTGRADVKPEYHEDLKRIAGFMNRYPSTSAIIEGHTDNVGTKAVNVRLSRQRAANIKTCLAERFGVDRSRMKAIGYDYQKPVASNRTAEGRQKNRRGETLMETEVFPERSYSFIDDSDLPKGGLSVVNQESIEAKIKSFKERQGIASYSSKTVKGATLELYLMWGGVFSHCAIRIEANPESFYQLELQALPDLKKAGLKGFRKNKAVINLLGMTEERFDIVEFEDKNERKKLDDLEPNYAAMPICIGKKADRKSTQEYRDCLRRYAESYNPENTQKNGEPAKAFEYNPITRNCCNFAEEALEACGLAPCFDLGKSTGLHHKTGPLEE